MPDSIAVISPKAITVRPVLLDTPRTASMRNANRRATPWVSMAWAMMNAPIKVKTVEEPNGASTVSASLTPSRTISAMPIRPPMGIGTASVIHSVTTPSRIAASLCWLGSRSSGSGRKMTITAGARNRPAVRRPRSKRSSCGLSFCSPRLR